ncbi:MAG: TrmO family methyltransferase, partial [bacterium]
MDKAAIPFKPIGVIHSPYTDAGDAPMQGVFKPEVGGMVEVFPEYEDGLMDIDGFSHLILIYYFHKAEHYSLITTPYL